MASALAMAAVTVTGCRPPGVYGDGAGNGAGPTRSPGVKAQQPGPGLQTTGVSPDDPFLGSPARDYANGADGIELPPAKPVAGFTASQVRGDLKTVRMVLVLANLDAHVWTGQRPRTLLNLIEPRHGYRARYERSFSRPSSTSDPLSIATRFDPRRAAVYGQIVKVHGKMSVKGVETGHLRVHIDYLFVYAVRPPGGAPPTTVERVVIRRTSDYDFYDPRRFQATPGTFVLQRNNFNVANSDCENDSGYIRPVFDGTPEGSEPSGAPVDPYDMSHADDSGDCRPLART